MTRPTCAFTRLLGAAKPLRTYRAKEGPPLSFSKVPSPPAARPRALEVTSGHCPAYNAGVYGDVLDHPPFVGRLQCGWVTPRPDGSDWCALCRGPVTDGRSSHFSFNRDHIALNFFVLLCVRFPRTWHPVQAVHRAWRAFPAPVARAVGAGYFTPDDAQRRAVLRALIMHLAEAPHCVVRRSVRGEAVGALTGQGEKIFRATIGELVGVMLPPMGPNVAAAFQQKAWGRTNLMRVFDAVGLGPLMLETYGAEVRDGRGDKSAVVRQMVCELHMAALLSDAQLNNFFPPQARGGVIAAELAGVLVRLLALECVILKSADYMHRCQHAVMALGYPSPDALRRVDFY